MPRKRATKQRALAKPKATFAQPLSEEQLKTKADQLMVFLNDFDVQVNLHKKKMARTLSTLELDTRKKFREEIQKLPLKLRQMTFKEFQETVSQNQTEQVVTKTTESKAEKIAKIQQLQWKNSCDGTLDVIQETEELKEENVKNPPPSTGPKKRGKAGRPAKQPPPSSSRTRSAQRPPSARASSRQCTPASRPNPYGATPLYTPRFDPTIGVTPAETRAIRDGEIAVSITGSPVTIPRIPENLSPERERKLEAMLEEPVPTRTKFDAIFRLFRELM